MGRMGSDDQVREVEATLFWIQIMIVRTLWKSSWNEDAKNVLKNNIWIENDVDRAFQRWRGRTRGQTTRFTRL